MTEGVELIEANGVIELHLDRADKKNALTAAMYRTLIAALAEASGRADVGPI